MLTVPQNSSGKIEIPSGFSVIPASKSPLFGVFQIISIANNSGI